MTQPTALGLADELEMWTLGEPAAEELRRLHAINAQLVEALESILSIDAHSALTEDEADAIDRNARAALAAAKEQA